MARSFEREIDIFALIKNRLRIVELQNQIAVDKVVADTVAEDQALFLAGGEADIMERVM